MKREQKAAVVDELAERLGEAGAIFAVDYRGISVTQAAELRTRLRESDATFKVVKNRLAKRAAEQAGSQGLEGLDPLLSGPIALTLVQGDPVTAAKTISNFARDHDVLAYRGGIMDGAELDPAGFEVIARLPGVDALRGQLVGLAASPLTGLAAGMANMISGLGRQLAQVAERGLVTGEAPAEPAVEEPEVADEPAAEPEAEARDADPAAETSTETDNEDSPSDAEAEAAAEAEGSDPEEE